MILNLSNFIHSLLLENETVIIPGFGAFISTYKPAEISGNEIKPPSKEISFTTQIKNNDGLLVEIIARKAKISQRNAMKRVDKARENMLYELDNGESVILENIGRLSYNEKNEIQFTPFEEENLLLDSFGLETITMKDSVEKPDETEAEEVIVPAVEAAIMNETGNDPEITDKPESQSITEEAEPENQTENIPEDEKGNKPVSEPIVAEPFKYPEYKQAQVYEEPEERKRKSWLWYLLLLIPILIVAYFMLNKNSKTEITDIGPEQSPIIELQEPPVEEIAPVDNVQTDSLQTAETEEPVNIIPEPVLTHETGKYYLVGGGFESEENAENYILQLKEKGIEGFLCGKKGKLFLVGIESFDSEDDAMKSLNKHFKSNPKWKLWIFKK